MKPIQNAEIACYAACVCFIPSFSIRDRKVLGLMPRISAAPFLPCTTQWVSFKASPERIMDSSIRTMGPPASTTARSTPDEKHLYVSNWDVEKKVVMRYDVDPEGNLANGKVFFDMTSAAGRTPSTESKWTSKVTSVSPDPAACGLFPQPTNT